MSVIEKNNSKNTLCPFSTDCLSEFLALVRNTAHQGTVMENESMCVIHEMQHGREDMVSSRNLFLDVKIRARLKVSAIAGVKIEKITFPRSPILGKEETLKLSLTI
jgi:hypothetical protein